MVLVFVKGADYEPTIVFFSMCRPIEDLETQVVLEDNGFISGYEPTLSRYDVLSAFSMSYKGQGASLGKSLASREWELPLFPAIVNRRLRKQKNLVL